MHQETISKSEIVGLGTKVENEKESPLGPSAPLGLQICKVVTILKEITTEIPWQKSDPASLETFSIVQLATYLQKQ